MSSMQQIHQFDPVIYPRLLFAAIAVDIDEIMKHVKLSAKDEDYLRSNPQNIAGVCFPVSKIEDNKKGVLVYFPNHEISVDDMAHESVHIADYMFEEIGACGQDFSNTNEPFAYLVGWSAGCIDKVKRNEF